MTPAVAATPDNAVDRNETVDALRQIKALHDEGILTGDEYESKRQRLADRL